MICNVLEDLKLSALIYVFLWENEKSFVDIRHSVPKDGGASKGIKTRGKKRQSHTSF